MIGNRKDIKMRMIIVLSCVKVLINCNGMGKPCCTLHKHLIYYNHGKWRFSPKNRLHIETKEREKEWERQKEREREG